MHCLSGMVVSGYGGFYQVRLEDGQVVNCKPRGRMKKEFSKIYSGDKVEISFTPEDNGVIETIAPRRVLLPRPNIANVDRLLLVLAWTMPDFDLLLADRMLVIAARVGVAPVLCFNKIDLLPEADRSDLDDLRQVYAAAGVPVLAISATENVGVDQVRKVLADGITVMAGQSGVGKSSLLNRLLPEERRKRAHHPLYPHFALG